MHRAAAGSLALSLLVPVALGGCSAATARTESAAATDRPAWSEAQARRQACAVAGAQAQGDAAGAAECRIEDVRTEPGQYRIRLQVRNAAGPGGDRYEVEVERTGRYVRARPI